MDVTQALKDTENALRDFIAVVLQKSLGDYWVQNCGVTQERVEAWTERKAVEEKRQESGAVEERLIYYADFYDLKTILKKHWTGEFSSALGDWKTMEVWLTEVEKLRDPDAHRRELLPHQKHLVLGIAGEIRTRLVRYRSKQETSDDYFPRIESVRDNFGNIWTLGQSLREPKTILRPNDMLEFVITASDPLGGELEYALDANRPFQRRTERIWQKTNSLHLVIEEEDIGTRFRVHLLIRSLRQYHAFSDCDDSSIWVYAVLPPVK